MSKATLFFLPFLGTGVSIGAGFYSGYKVYRLVWPKKWFAPQLTAWNRLTFEEAKKRMDEFKEGIKNSKYEETVPLSAIPMPGENMFWAHPEDNDFWNERSKVLQTTGSTSIPHDIKKLKSWCALHMNTQVYASNMNGKVKFRSSKDSHVYVDSFSQLTDLSDVKNNCSRMITNEEFYKDHELAKGEDKWNKNKCDELLKKHYSKFSVNNTFMNNCLASRRPER